jgi:hypothetical protein
MTPCAIQISNVWEVARRLDLYGQADMELEALIARHRGSPKLVDGVAVEAARFIRNLRREAAAGSFL